MNNFEFEQLLKLAKLTKKEFAQRNGLHKNSVTNWKQKEIPEWVEPWLKNYIKAQAFDAVLDTALQLSDEINS